MSDVSLPTTLNKTTAACQSIIEMARQVGTDGKLPTFRAMCDTLGVSRMTLDRALTRLEREGLVARHHGRGIYWTGANKQDKAIALVFGLDPFTASGSDFYRLTTHHAREVCAELGYELQLHVDPPWSRETSHDRHRLEQAIIAGQVQGIIAPVVSGQEQYQWLTSLPVTHVMMQSEATLLGTGVVFNLGDMIHQGVKALKDRGCRRIGLVSLHHTYDVQTGRHDRSWTSFQFILRRLGLPLNPQWTCRLIGDDEKDRTADFQGHEELIYHAMRRRLASWPADQRPDGLISLDDMATRGLIAAMNRTGLRLGRDIHVASHCNRGSSSLLGYEQMLIRMEVDPAMYARHAVSLMADLIEHREPAHRQIVLSSRLLLPESAANRQDDEASRGAEVLDLEKPLAMR